MLIAKDEIFGPVMALMKFKYAESQETLFFKPLQCYLIFGPGIHILNNFTDGTYDGMS